MVREDREAQALLPDDNKTCLSVDDEKYPSMCQVLVFQFHDRFSTASGCGAQTEGNDSLMHLIQRHISVCNIHQQRPEEGKRHNLRQLLHHQRRCQGHAAGVPREKRETVKQSTNKELPQGETKPRCKMQVEEDSTSRAAIHSQGSRELAAKAQFQQRLLEE